MSKLVRRSGTADLVDTAIGVAAVVVVAVVALSLIGWIFGLVVTVLKIAILAVIVAVAIRFLSGRRDRY